MANGFVIMNLPRMNFQERFMASHNHCMYKSVIENTWTKTVLKARFHQDFGGKNEEKEVQIFNCLWF